jgi:hypothetical protein
LQAAALIQGEYRYGPGNREQRYSTRLLREIGAYIKTGNKEHLINVSNYCILESIYPEHENHHYNDEVESVTRSIVAWNKSDAKKKWL